MTLKHKDSYPRTTGSIEVYLDEGQGYPATPTLQATDASYPELRRLGWAARVAGYNLYVDWIVATEGTS